MAAERLVDLRERDLHTTLVHELLDATDDERVAVRVDISQIAEAEPAVGGTVAIERSDEVDDQFWHVRLLSG